MEKTWEAAKRKLSRLMAEKLITCEAEFVPFSQSRNKGAEQPSLNWRVKVLKDGREVLATDYMQGCGHCPAYKASTTKLGHANSVARHDALKYECETGRSAFLVKGSKIPAPDAADVFSSLLLDAGAIDYSTCEEWATDFGYDPDSRSGERLYRQCLEIGLKLRAALGDKALERARSYASEM